MSRLGVFNKSGKFLTFRVIDVGEKKPQTETAFPKSSFFRLVHNLSKVKKGPTDRGLESKSKVRGQLN